MIKATTGLELDREAMKKIARNISNDTRRLISERALHGQMTGYRSDFAPRPCPKPAK